MAGAGSQPLAFMELAAGGILLVAALTGDSIGRILSGEHHKGDPAANPIHPGTSSSSSSTPGTKAAAAAPTALGAPATPGAAPGVGTSGFVNPLLHAHVTPERIDQGVDFAGTGYYTSPGAGRVVSAGPGWLGGNEVVIELIDGTLVFFEEGVRPLVRAGQKIAAGQPVASLIPGFHSGTELGFATRVKSGGNISPGVSTYAAGKGGGYQEGQLTAAGEAFSKWLKRLGAPEGTRGGRRTVGHFP